MLVHVGRRFATFESLPGQRWRRIAPATAVAIAFACAPGVTLSPGTATAPSAEPTRPAPVPTSQPSPAWPLRLREHVDLWLHGFALLQEDSTLVPYYRRDYRKNLSATRSARGLTSQLDANGERLRGRLTTNPGLISAQFVPLYFATWDELRQSADAFLRLEGDVRAARDQRTAEMVATFAAYFPSAADRDWLRLFLLSLEDERTKFYSQYWREEQRKLGPAFDAADLAWRSTYGARFQRFLANSQQHDGEVLLSLPLSGEGRTLTDRNRRTTMAIGFPAGAADAAAVVYVFAHEIVGTVANAVITDNTSPADQRSGVAARYSSLGAVRGGAMLLGRVAPELVPGYMAYYLDLARRSGMASDIERLFATTFPLPDNLRDALQRQIDIILGGI